MRVFIDIETIPSQHPEARERARAGVKPPGNYKKAESIAAWWETEGEQAAQDAYLKGALDATEGEVVALSYAIDDLPPVAHVRGKSEPEAGFLSDVLGKLTTAVDVHLNQHGDARFPETPYPIAHNAMFDLGFIRRRCMALGVRPPTWWPSLFARDGRDYGDTMTAWAGPRERISLDRLCRALGVPSPKAEGVNGGDVFELWEAERYADLASYNVRDVIATRACWQRMQFEQETAA